MFSFLIERKKIKISKKLYKIFYFHFFLKLFFLFLLFFNDIYFAQALAAKKNSQGSPKKTGKSSRFSPNKSHHLFKPATQIIPERVISPPPKLRRSTNDPTNADTLSDDPIATKSSEKLGNEAQKIPKNQEKSQKIITTLDSSDSENDDFSISHFDPSNQMNKERNDSIIFSPSSLIPLTNAIQEKYDVPFTESFPNLIDAALEANSSVYINTIYNAKNTLNEIISISNEAEENSTRLLAKSEAIQAKADIALGQIHNAKNSVNTVLRSRFSVAVYIIFFITFLINTLFSLFNYMMFSERKYPAKTPKDNNTGQTQPSKNI